MSGIRETIRRINEDVYGAGRVELVDELFHEDYIEHTAREGRSPGREGVKSFVQAMHAAISGAESSMDRFLLDGDQVAWRWTLRGKHTGEFMGVPASDREIEVTGNDLGVIRDGKLAEVWSEVDMLAVMTQLGASPRG
jgi:steroid delta-isomerase-like uncharacterized protein